MLEPTRGSLPEPWDRRPPIEGPHGQLDLLPKGILPGHLGVEPHHAVVPLRAVEEDTALHAATPQGVGVEDAVVLTTPVIQVIQRIPVIQALLATLVMGEVVAGTTTVVARLQGPPVLTPGHLGLLPAAAVGSLM